MTRVATRTCLVADDHPALATAVVDFLGEGGLLVLGPAADGVHAAELAAEHRPEFAVVDWRMPKLAGSELLGELRRVAPETAIVVYTAEADEELARTALGAGAAALVLKEAPLADLVRALEAVASGQPYVDAGVARSPAAGTLTPRELEVIALIADGLSHDEVGLRLGIGAETVRTHMKKACNRLGATTRTQAVAVALRLGLIA
jgi:DNA-binding NarL/FixJ family response regulator